MLLTIFHDPGITQEELSRLIDIDKTRIARSCILLEESGLITRTRDAEDRRKYHVALNAEGEKLVPVIRGVIAEWGRLITEGMTPEQIGDLSGMLDIITQNARDYEGGHRI